jgi:DNA-directed RNA polymerase subunit M/transcription elongation factor TFIIS
MTFCKKCGSILKSLNGILVCGCGQNPLQTKEIIIELQKPVPPIRVVTDDRDNLAVYDHECSECGYKKAQLMSKGIQYSDEDEELEFICGKCGHHDPADGLRAK